jgi:hypothetical protein
MNDRIHNTRRGARRRPRRPILPAWSRLGLIMLLLAGAWPAELVAAAPPAGSACATRPGHLLWSRGVSPRPMALDDFPRPPADNGRGLHWIPTGAQSAAVVDRFVDEARAMRIAWVTFLNDDASIGANDYLVRRLVEAGIMPVMRVYTPNGRPIRGDLGAMVSHYRALGVRYFQLYNEPNNSAENEGGAPDPERYVQRWSDAARLVLLSGGLPGFGALSPGGDADDLGFLDAAVAALERRGQVHLLDCAWLALHNYAFNRPIDYAGDRHAYLGFRLYDDIIRRRLGRPLPMIGTEGGTHLGVAFDPTYPPVDEARQVELVLDGYRYLQRPEREPFYFAASYWVIANAEGGGPEPAWEPQALFQPAYASPLVDRLRALP